MNVTSCDVVSVRMIVVAGESSGQATRESLASCPGVAVVGVVHDGTGLDQAVARGKANLVLLDATYLLHQLPGIVKDLRSACPDCRILVIAASDDDAMAMEALRLGAHGHVLEDAYRSEALATAIRTVTQGAAVVSPRMAGHILDRIVQLRQTPNKDQVR